MIRTDKQLKITKEKIAEFEQALTELNAKKESISPLDFKIEESGLVSMLGQFKAETEEYEMLSDPNTRSTVLRFEIHDFSDMLIKARLVRKMSQSELAKRIGVEPQAIQRYEANGYDGVGFDRLLQIQYALKFEVDCEAQVMDDSIFDLDGMGEEEIKEQETQMRTKGIFQS
jgi:transcriptional regulator with XRE-family HTH domain